MILFQLSNIPTNFQDYINKILAKNPYIFDIIYLDDMLIYIKNLSQDYIKTVR